MAIALSRNEDNSPSVDCRLLVAPIGGGLGGAMRANAYGHGTVNNLGGYLG